MQPLNTMRKVIFCGFLLLSPFITNVTLSQHSAAREWNENLLNAIRKDYARPTVHARNLFHISAAMYDAWAIYDDLADTYLIGNTVNGYVSPFLGVSAPANIDSARSEAISYAAYRIMKSRFSASPGAAITMPAIDTAMVHMGYDIEYSSTNYQSDSAAALGNYIAEQYLAYGDLDNSNEANSYVNQYYNTVNPALVTKFEGNPDIDDPNRWQPLSLDVFIDQGGNEIPINTPEFLSPEWGQVHAFALDNNDLTTYNRDAFDYWVFHDPGAPPYIDTVNGGAMTDEYQWGFALVSVWSSHLDPADSVKIDISPASIGNITNYPQTIPDYRNFYDLENGGDPSPGHPYNPVTGQPYETQEIYRGDYGRVLAEFWADGPDSETPPGHWFTLLNYVSDHPQFSKRYNGKGDEIDDLEWDIKSYFTLAGAMHDAAVTAWGVKGWYDYLRPISAIRYMADRGQSTSDTLPNYHIAGIPLLENYVELVDSNDALVGGSYENLNKIKVYAWKGPDYISDPETDHAGVGWILAENWWPYQRPTFVTPPFAGYVSGHSTFSRAAAEVMTLLTGDAFFPGGMGEFLAEKNEFLVFEEGPSTDVTLQWATYRDASDQCSLSRIWGGIHPPADDIPGRMMGIDIGVDAFFHAKKYFTGNITGFGDGIDQSSNSVLYPNFVEAGQVVHLELRSEAKSGTIQIQSIDGKVVRSKEMSGDMSKVISFNTSGLAPGLYLVNGEFDGVLISHKLVVR